MMVPDCPPLISSCLWMFPPCHCYGILAGDLYVPHSFLLLVVFPCTKISSTKSNRKDFEMNENPQPKKSFSPKNKIKTITAALLQKNLQMLTDMNDQNLNLHRKNRLQTKIGHTDWYRSVCWAHFLRDLVPDPKKGKKTKTNQLMSPKCNNSKPKC